MAVNWLEEIVSHLYKLRGYIVFENEDLPMPNTGRHSDLDIIAIKDGELIHVECMAWWGPGIKVRQEEFERLKNRFERAPDVIFGRYNFLHRPDYKIINIFVTSGKPKKKNKKEGPWDHLETFCKENKIELVEINTIIRDVVHELKRKCPRPDRVDKLPPLARFLLHLIHNQFLKIEPEANSQEKLEKLDKNP